MEVADFSGYATKANLVCSDGRTILPDAFKHQDKMTVPLVWSHNAWEDPENVLGHVQLEAKDGHMRAHAYFNQNPKSQKAKHMVEHGDVKWLSIRAGRLKEQLKQVAHGMIQEVSLVLAGANPGAQIDMINIRHNDGIGGYELQETDEAYITTGEDLVVLHADGDRTVMDVYNDMSEEQQDLVHFFVAEALKEAGVEHADDEGEEASDQAEDSEGSEESAEAENDGETDGDEAEEADESEESSTESEDTESEDDTESGADAADEATTEDSLDHQEGTRMNVFDQNGEGNVKDGEKFILHAEHVQSILKDAQRRNSLSDALDDFCLEHGIDDVDMLFPEARLVDGNEPNWVKRRTEWVQVVLDSVHTTPFSRVKSRFADITQDKARALGYIKGNMKKEEWFGLTQRSTTPTTVYKKQSLDRDDILDASDFNLVAWMRGEMRLMLEEEVARAILLGDGRPVEDPANPGEPNPDKIKDPAAAADGAGIRSILYDHEFYVTDVTVNVDDASSSWEEVTDQVLMNRRYYRGSGGAVFFTTAESLARLLLSRDGFGRKVYESEAALATALRVSRIVEVEVMEDHTDLIGIIVNLVDYNVGTDRGGEITSFEDFDIDFNKNKWLLETRLSGALTKYKSAIRIWRTASTNVLRTPVEPSFNEATGVVTIPTVTGVVYKNAAGSTLTAGAQTALDLGDELYVKAVPGTNSYFSDNEDDEWTFEGQVEL